MHVKAKVYYFVYLDRLCSEFSKFQPLAQAFLARSGWTLSAAVFYCLPSGEM